MKNHSFGLRLLNSLYEPSLILINSDDSESNIVTFNDSSIRIFLPPPSEDHPVLLKDKVGVHSH